MKAITYILIICVLAGKCFSFFNTDYTLVFLSFEPPLFIVTLLLWIIALFFKSKNEFHYLIILCLTFSSFANVFSPLNLTVEANWVNEINIINYNVKALRFYESVKTDDSTVSFSETKQILNWIKSKPSELLCLQEFLLKPSDTIQISFIDSLLHVYPYCFFNDDSLDIKSDLVRPVLFSDYEIINSGVLEGGCKLNETIFADLKTNEGVLRVYNCHLYSNYINQKDWDDNGICVINKVLESSKERSFQVDILLKHIEDCPYSFIICGDFNETPLSVIYTDISHVAQDAHLLSGNGYGSTFHHDILPNIRIDYQFFSKGLGIVNEEVLYKVEFSDHYPVKGTYFLKRSTD